MGNAVEQSLTPDERICADRRRVGADAHRQAQRGRLPRAGRAAEEHTGIRPARQLHRTPGFRSRRSAERRADRPAFEAWMRTQFSPVLQQLGYTARPNDTPEDKQKRAPCCSVRWEPWQTIRRSIQQANTMVQELMKDPTSVDGTLAPGSGRGCCSSRRRRSL